MAASDTREAFDSIDVSGDGFISSSELGAAMRRLGLNPTKSDICAALLELDANNDGRVSFPEFKKYFRRFAKRHLGGRTNKLLVKDLVGHTRLPGYDLPPEGHRFGKVLPRDPEGAGDVMLNWKGGKRSSPPRPPRNMVAMNAKAAAAGCTTSKEARQFQSDNPEMVITKASTGPARRGTPAAAREPDTVFGHKNRPSTPIGALIQGRFGTMNEEDRSYPQRTAADERAARKKALPPPRMTKAAIGQSTHAAKKEEAAKQQFKMRKFQNVKPRVFGDAPAAARAASARTRSRRSAREEDAAAVDNGDVVGADIDATGVEGADISDAESEA